MSLNLYPCPNGHLSTDADYCSECGKKLDAAPAGGPPDAAPPPGLSGGAGEVCPDCGTLRANPTAMFCEVCRYNFLTHQSWTPDAPVVAPVAPTPPVGPAAAAPDAYAAATNPPPAPRPAAVDASLRRWEAVVVVDPSLYADPDPANPVPVNAPERVFPLDFPENLLGRRSERRAIYPEVDLSGDSGVSSRHAILYREPDGNVTLLDVGSTNGTQINGTDVAPGVRVPLNPGDQITLGCWTRITLRDAGGKP